MRHARHPLHGWRRWAVIVGQGAVGFVALFAAVNLVLSLSTFRARIRSPVRSTSCVSSGSARPMAPPCRPRPFPLYPGGARKRAAIAFSASQNAKFGIDTHTERLSAEIALFDPNAYDFPSSGEALHEMTRITNDPAQVATTIETLKGAQVRLAAEGLTYGLLAPNSNTAVRCVLQGSGAIAQQARSSILLALRAPGFGAECE